MSGEDSVKWMCRACSYANWPLARKCVLCLTPKDGVIDSETGKVKMEAMQQPKINKWTCKVRVNLLLVFIAAFSLSAFPHHSPSNFRFYIVHPVFTHFLSTEMHLRELASLHEMHHVLPET